AAAYSIGTISGAHLNPAVAIGMWLNKRMTTMELIYYGVGQIVGGLIASCALLSSRKGAGKSIENLGQNGVGELSGAGALTVEIMVTFICVLVVMTGT
ncbi:aquaporin, partial [Enterococcus faecalis]|uniref:aquaporin n=1 Tax=Enterococcus faecalis TaxID=1351 RepID=UPI002FBDDB5E